MKPGRNSHDDLTHDRCSRHSAATAAALSLGRRFASAEAETVRIGVIYDLSGPFAAGGSVACSIGAQIAIDLVNERGGVAGKYKVVPINADCRARRMSRSTRSSG